MQPAALRQLERWGISEGDATRAGLFDVGDARSICSDFQSLPAIVLPYFNADGTLATYGAAQPFCRVRYLDAPKASPGWAKHRDLRYGQPARSGLKAYFPPLLDWRALLANPREPVLLTEGEAKALAGTLAAFPTIAFGGVFNWSRDGAMLPELDAAAWQGRDVFIVFDSDATLNPQVLMAEARLVEELQHRRGAKCFLVRLPHGENKVGMDDYLREHGAAAFLKLLEEAPSLGALDAKVIALNKSCAWIEREGLIYDTEMRAFISKDNFTTGSRFSSLKHITLGAKQRTDSKSVSVAKTWLTHAHAQRFDEILFRPSEEPTVPTENGRRALNMWTGWEPGEGDVTPFLDLSEFLFSGMAAEHRSLPLNLLTYKAQNPQVKIPLALVLIGMQGCGKTLWGECVRDAFAPYGIDVTPQALAGEFQGWLERSLMALINEAKGEDIERASEQLKALISDLKRPMNEKYRPVRQINTYTQYIITSNRRAVGAYSPDDRRMIVVDCPAKREHEFYERVGAWKQSGGPKALLGWLLRRDLRGWKPPEAAPMTPEKYMAYVESLSPVARAAEEMRTADGNRIKLWIDQALAWAHETELSGNPDLAKHARAIATNLPHLPVRDWYTPEELLLIFPNLIQFTRATKLSSATVAGEVSRQLREAGVPYLQCADDPRGFRHGGVIRQYLVVCNFNDWREPLRQSDFDRAMTQWPTYGALRARSVA